VSAQDLFTDPVYEQGYQDGMMDAEATPKAGMFDGAKVSVGIVRNNYQNANGPKASVNIEVPIGSSLHAFFESIATKRTSDKSPTLRPEVPVDAVKITTGAASILIAQHGGKPIVSADGRNMMTVTDKTYYWGKKTA
jgi:hypothetical protein